METRHGSIVRRKELSRLSIVFEQFAAAGRRTEVSLGWGEHLPEWSQRCGYVHFMRSETAKSVDAYLAAVESGSARDALSRLRSIIREEAPDAEEVISYGIPTYKLNKTMMSFAAFKNHCSLFPGYTVQEFADQLKAYKISKGTIQFTPGNPLPEPLVRAIVQARFWPKS